MFFNDGAQSAPQSAPQNQAVIDEDTQDQYENNGFISQSVDKEEREQGVQTPILGNVKVFFTDGAQSAPQSAPQSKAVIDEDIPF